MLSALQALDFPYSFSQAPTLPVSEFLKAARDRGMAMTEPQLEGLHRLRLLVPLWRYTRDSAQIRRAGTVNPFAARQLAAFPPVDRRGLCDARAGGQLRCALDEPFMPMSRRRRSIPEHHVSWLTSEYLYSHHQLSLLSKLAPALRALRYREGVVTGVDAIEPVLRVWRRESRQFSELAIVLSILEAAYWSPIMGVLRFPGAVDFDEYDRWRDGLKPRDTLRTIDATADQLTETADVLLIEADRIDPLRNVLDLISEISPQKREGLRGEARQAVDLRVSAELLMHLHDELTDAPGRQGPRYVPGSGKRHLTRRLRPSERLDPILTDYGLSPHPRLVLVVEGETELRFFPRVMELLGIHQDPRFITIESAASVDRDLTSLISYAAALHTEVEPEGRYLRLHRAPTRILVVMDPEGRMRTEKMREEARRGWIERLRLAMPPEHRTDAVQWVIERQIEVRTWSTPAESFEFAHFTDRRLALALARLDTRDAPADVDDWAERLVRVRRGGTLKPLIRKRRKLELAEELWPHLQRRIERAIPHETHRKIPIVDVTLQAFELANEWSRPGFVIPIDQTTSKPPDPVLGGQPPPEAGR
jgi:hypothetical protein